MKSTKDRIIEFIENQHITKSEFCLKAGLSNGYLTKKGAVTSLNLEKIVKAYPTIDLYYLIMGEHSKMIEQPVDTDELLLELNSKIDSVVDAQKSVHTFIDMLKGLTDLEQLRKLLEQHKPVETGDHSTS